MERGRGRSDRGLEKLGRVTFCCSKNMTEHCSSNIFSRNLGCNRKQVIGKQMQIISLNADIKDRGDKAVFFFNIVKKTLLSTAVAKTTRTKSMVSSASRTQPGERD